MSDLERTRAFWSCVLGPLGYAQTSSWADGFTLAKGDDAYLTFVQVRGEHAAAGYHRCAVGLNHLAFRVGTREAVDDLRRLCQERGFLELYPGQYPFATGDDYYALFLEDPDRIKAEFVAS